ncbi:LOW QUALITY PROTEIN: uncharacterized protein C2orf27A-like [Symphalangus syndactylus]|uniref:LOW QUALITY PROTEIN: uncharacterized protein C2orf27A-like n=1 Tax=Symphalangus syndactylus TaxID=9590 RepID=UPI003006512B
MKSGDRDQPDQHAPASGAEIQLFPVPPVEPVPAPGAGPPPRTALELEEAPEPSCRCPAQDQPSEELPDFMAPLVEPPASALELKVWLELEVAERGDQHSSSQQVPHCSQSWAQWTLWRQRPGCATWASLPHWRGTSVIQQSSSPAAEGPAATAAGGVCLPAGGAGEQEKEPVSRGSSRSFYSQRRPPCLLEGMEVCPQLGIWAICL